MLSVPEASARILEHIGPLPAERVPLMDALGRVLAEAVRAPMTLPAWDNSAMDGFALCGGDLAPDEVTTLTLIDEQFAGADRGLRVAPGCAPRHMG